MHPATSYELSYAIVSAMTRHHEAYVESATSEVWKLEQQVTGGEIDDPEEFLNELFRTRHGLLAVRTMGVLSGAIYGRMSNLVRVSPDGKRLIADLEDQFDRVASIADGEKEYLQGVIEFYRTVLQLKGTLAGETRNEEIQRPVSYTHLTLPTTPYV